MISGHSRATIEELTAIGPDSGYLSRTSSQFGFDEETPSKPRMMASTMGQSAQDGSNNTSELPWELAESEMYNRRKRSWSDSHPRLRANKQQRESRRSVSCEPLTTAHASTGTQTDAHACSCHLPRQISEQRPFLSGAGSLIRTTPRLTATVRPYRLADGGRVSGEQRRRAEAVGGLLRVLGDQFEAERPGAFVGVQFHGALIGVFAAVPPPPQWLQDLWQWLRNV